jgi:hypothetical protein
MGRQIAIHLTPRDEDELVAYLKGKFPVEVVEQVYAPDWNHMLHQRKPDSKKWLIIDTRASDILINSANQFPSSAGRNGRWQVRSRALSCIEWARTTGPSSRPVDGRLYLNTNPGPIGNEISAATGDGVERVFESARRWIRSRCTKISRNGPPLWASEAHVEGVRTYLAEAKRRRAEAPKDPRDKEFYRLHRTKNSRLSDSEIARYIAYCERMLEHVAGHEEAVQSWLKLHRELQEMLRARRS